MDRQAGGRRVEPKPMSSLATNLSFQPSFFFSFYSLVAVCDNILYNDLLEVLTAMREASFIRPPSAHMPIRPFVMVVLKFWFCVD